MMNHIHAEPSTVPATPCRQAINPAWVAFFTRARELSALADARQHALETKQELPADDASAIEESSCHTNDRRE